MTFRAAMIPLFFFMGLMALFALPLLRGSDPSILPSAMIGKSAPNFNLPAALDPGAGFSTKDLTAGKGPVLVNFFSSWCMTCGAEHKLLSRIARDGVVIYGVDYKDKHDDIAQWLGRHGNPYKAVGFDEQGRTAIDWGVYGVPETFILDKGGVIRFRQVGPMTDEDYATKLKPVLTELGK